MTTILPGQKSYPNQSIVTIHVVGDEKEKGLIFSILPFKRR